MYICGVQRQQLQSILNQCKARECTILTGARQVGKTTLLKQTFEHLVAKKETAFYLTFEDGAILKAVSEHPENVFRFAVMPAEGKERVYLLIDEIQYHPDPTNFLKLLYDKYSPGLKIIATGSSAFYMDQKFKDSLAGRKKIIPITPLNFDEYLHFSGHDNLQRELKLIRQNQKYISAERNAIMNLFQDFLLFGGYPAVVLEEKREGKIEKLNELLFSFIKKDMLESGVEEEDKFYQLMRILANQAGSLLNRAEVSNTLRLNERTLERYIYILRKCFHIQIITPWSGNIRKEITKMAKVYFNDTGLCNALLRDYSPLETRMDKGMMLEHFVFHTLREKWDEQLQIHFWRTSDQNEVDFVVETKNNEGFALEVKWQEKEFKPNKYKIFRENYGEKFPLKPVCAEFDNAENWVLKM